MLMTFDIFVTWSREGTKDQPRCSFIISGSIYVGVLQSYVFEENRYIHRERARHCKIHAIRLLILYLISLR
jgi:hypothetical protein